MHSLLQSFIIKWIARSAFPIQLPSDWWERSFRRPVGRSVVRGQWQLSYKYSVDVTLSLTDWLADRESLWDKERMFAMGPTRDHQSPCTRGRVTGYTGVQERTARVESSVDRDRLSISCCPTTCVQMDHCVLFYGAASLPTVTRRDGRTSVYTYL